MGNSYSRCRAAEEEGCQLSRERRFELLSHERRRHVVGYLEEASSPVAVADIARRIAAHEATQRRQGDQDDPGDVNISLYHRHVPKLADAGVVEHDRDRNTVEPGLNFECVAALCDPPGDDDAST